MDKKKEKSVDLESFPGLFGTMQFAKARSYFARICQHNLDTEVLFFSLSDQCSEKEVVIKGGVLLWQKQEVTISSDPLVTGFAGSVKCK